MKTELIGSVSQVPPRGHLHFVTNQDIRIKLLDKLDKAVEQLLF